MTPTTDKLEQLSMAVTLTVLEIDFNPNQLIPVFLMANLMSPELWAWRTEKNAFSQDGTLLTAKSRLNKLQRFLHRYTFLNLPDEMGGDAWGLLNFAAEERRFGTAFVQQIQAEYDATFRKLLAENPASQFGQIINHPIYQQGYFPRLKNETVAVMNAFAGVDAMGGKRAGKCIGLSLLWAAAMCIWGRFPLDQIVIIGNRAHMFIFLDEADGHLLNNTKWFSATRINNRSDLSEFVRLVTSSTATTFFYNPAMGMCDCNAQTSQIPQQMITDLYAKISHFVDNPLHHPNPDHIQFVQSEQQILDPLAYDSAESYRATITALADEQPDSLYALALYAFRQLDVTYPQVYIRAALRDPHVKALAQEVRHLSDALHIIANIAGQTSIFESRERLALPDETLYFNRGDDRDRALLLYTLLYHSPICDDESMVGLSDSSSFVTHHGKWIDVYKLKVSDQEPQGLEIVFGEHECTRKGMFA